MLLLVLLVTGCSDSSEQSVAQLGQPAPDFELQNLEGQTVSLSDFRGKTVLLNFWATWCPPCRGEMPYLQQVHEEWSDSGVVLLAVDVGESPATVRQFMQDDNLSLPVLLDTRGSVAARYDIPGYPTTFFIDTDGVIQGRIIGPFPSKMAIENCLSQIIP